MASTEIADLNLPFITTAIDHSIADRIDCAGVSDDGDVPVILHRDDEQVQVPITALKMAERLRAAPRRALGSATCETRAAFVQHVNRMKGDHTALWAALRGPLTAIFDYHAPDRPSWMDLRAKFEPKHSEQFKAWNKEQKLTPEQLVELFDARYEDLAMPETKGKDGKVVRLKGEEPSKLVAAFSDVTIGSKSVRKKLNHVTGRMELTVTDAGASGGPQKHDLPHVFWVAVPVFEGEAKAALQMRITYITGSDGQFKVAPHNSQPTIDLAYELIRSSIAEETGLAITLGTPEKAPDGLHWMR